MVRTALRLGGRGVRIASRQTRPRGGVAWFTTPGLLQTFDLSNAALWENNSPGTLIVTPGATDPNGGAEAYAVTFPASIGSQLAQPLFLAPSATVEFSVYARSPTGHGFQFKIWNNIIDNFSPDVPVTTEWAPYSFQLTTVEVVDVALVNQSDGAAGDTVFWRPNLRVL